MLVLGYFAFGFVAAYLLVESIEKLLAGGSACECGAVVERASEAAEVEQAFGRAVEGNAHAVEQIDNAGSGIAHGLHWWLIGEEIAAVDRIVKMLPGRITFTFEILGGVNSTLGTNRM